ncbi:anti-repressor SinI family protein [Neobacillus sp. LXY-4]
MNVENLGDHQDLDYEWVGLIIMALEMGVTEEEIRTFLEESKPHIEA